MNPIAATLLLLLFLTCGCVDADDSPTTIKHVTATDYGDDYQPTARTESRPDYDRTVSYLSEKPWHGWDESPERVKVTVQADGDRHTHYFESLPVAYGWLPERYGEFDIVDMVIANALTGRDLLDTRSAFYLMSRDYSRSLPVVLAYPSRQDAAVFLDRYPDRYTLVDWGDLDRDMDHWRSTYWGDWRDDFGLVRTATVAHLDGTFWDGWYTTPDRVLVRMSSGGNLSSYYFDSLPVAWSWIDRRPSGFDMIDLQIAAADGSLRLLPARDASYVWMPAGSDALPAVLAFATANEATRYLSALNNDAFKVVDWDDLKPRLTSWSHEHWNAWRGNPEHNRGIARALESGLGKKLGLRKSEGGVVAGEHKLRERADKQIKARESATKLKSDGKGKVELTGKPEKTKMDRGASKGKAKSVNKSRHENHVRHEKPEAGKSLKAGGGTPKIKRSDHGNSKAKGAGKQSKPDRHDPDKSGHDKGGKRK